MEWAYWKVVIRYGHVGKRNEVSVARYLAVPNHMKITDVLSLAEEMPGTKSRAVFSAGRVSLLEYLEGKRAEQENFFLQKLFEYSKAE